MTNSIADAAPKPACAACAFAVKVRPHPTAIETQLLCQRLPPTPVAIPGNGQVRIMALHPVVAPVQWCYEFRPAADLGALTVDTPIASEAN